MGVIIINLITTMIVEDEYLILNDMTTIVDWEMLGYKIVATALNGAQGIKKFEQFKPQLILTDIKMPDTNGLDMMRSIKHQAPSTKFLIISSYDDFEFAKEAIRLGADDYILKSEISAEYLEKKLLNVKSSVLTYGGVLMDSVQKLIMDLLRSKEAPVSEAVDVLLTDPYIGIVASNLGDIVDFTVNNTKEAYERHGIAELFQPPEVSTPYQFSKWFYEQLYKLHEVVEMIYRRNYSPTVINAIEFINKNYCNPDLVIKDISDAVYVSVSRLCVLFKKELDKTVNDVITEKRIKEAQKLLCMSNLKVYEVSEKVGYKTSQYFSRIFFQHTGQTPNNCRKPNTDENK